MIEQANDIYECHSPTYWKGHFYEVGETVLVKPGGGMTNINFRLVKQGVPMESEVVDEKARGRKKKTPEA